MRRRSLVSIVAGVSALAVSELAAAVALPLVNRRLDVPVRRVSEILTEQTTLVGQLLDPEVDQLIELHPQLGWRYAPSYHRDPHQLNAAALRAAREYSTTVPAGILRIAAFGDSFVYGAEVANEEAWPRLMEKGGDVEVLNYGVPGYGTDQACLRYELEGLDYSPSIVVLGFAPTDMSRVVNVYRRFYDSREVPLFKPRFRLDAAGRLTLLEPPVRDRPGYERLMRHPEEAFQYGDGDQWFEPLVYRNPFHDLSAMVRLGSAAMFRIEQRIGPNRLVRADVFNSASEAYRLHLAIFDRFAAIVRLRGGVPVILMLPDERALGAIEQHRPPVYEPLVNDLKARGIDVLDAASAFPVESVNFNSGDWFAPGGHYAPGGNRLVAEWLASVIRSRFVGA